MYIMSVYSVVIFVYYKCNVSIWYFIHSVSILLTTYPVFDILCIIDTKLVYYI